MSAMVPRYYQRGALDALYAYWRQGGGNGLIVLPTAAGKSLVIALLCQELLAQYPDLRIGIVTHVAELIGQNAQELLGVWPDAPVGIYSAGLGRRQSRHQITFMGIQSVYNKADIFRGFDILLVDEAHLMPRDAETMYGKFISGCRESVLDMRIVGLTATDYRTDSGRLTGDKGCIFDDVVYEVRVGKLIEDGYISPLIGLPTLALVDMQGVKSSNGEFNAVQTEERVADVLKQAIAEIVEKGHDRAGWMVFCSGIENCRNARDEFRLYQVTCEMITGKTPKGERKRIIAAYRRGEIRCLVSVGVLTTGFNAKHVDLLAMLRPTKSPGLYVQIVGRGFRVLYAAGYDLDTAEGRHAAIAAGPKPNCLVLDFAGNIALHGPIDDVRPPAKRKAKKDKDADEEVIQADEDDDTVKARMCPHCLTLAPAGAVQCLVCQYEWPPEVARHQANAENIAILSTEAVAPSWTTVFGVTLARHQKEGSYPSLRVTYSTSSKMISQWLCFEHPGSVRGKAHAMWRKLGGAIPEPQTVTEAIERKRELGKVDGVLIQARGKYSDVMNVRMAGWDDQDRAVLC